MTNKYLIAIDMDGTLLTDKKKITFKTKRYLQKLQKQGHIIMLASGRPSRALRFFYDKMKLNGPLICYNGSYLFHPYEKDFPITKFLIDKNIVKQIINDTDKGIINNVMCETDDKIWLIKEEAKLGSFFWHYNMEIFYGDINETLKEDPWTMIVEFNDFNNIDSLTNSISKHAEFSYYHWGKVPYLEIYHTNVNKYTCVEIVRNHYNIPIENVICFGDANNDILMCEKCFNGVAMINGNDEIKAKSKYITKKDNNHNGVIHFLKYFLKNK